MELFLIISLLIIPVLLLASPSAIFAIKGRPDIALGYLGCLVLLQVTVLAAYWNQPAEAASWVCLLLGLSALLSLSYMSWKLDRVFWLPKLFGFIVINAALLSFGISQNVLTF